MKSFGQSRAEKAFLNKYGFSVSDFQHNIGKSINCFYYLRMLTADYLEIYKEESKKCTLLGERNQIEIKIKVLERSLGLMNKYGFVFGRFVKEDIKQWLYICIPMSYDLINHMNMLGDYCNIYNITDISEFDKSFPYDEFLSRRRNNKEETATIIKEGYERNRYLDYLSKNKDLDSMFDNISSSNNSIGGYVK